MADTQLRAVLQGAWDQNEKGVILDLHKNRGALNDQAVTVKSDSLKGGNVFIDQDAYGKQTGVPVTAGGTAEEVPHYVLIGGGADAAPFARKFFMLTSVGLNSSSVRKGANRG